MRLSTMRLARVRIGVLCTILLSLLTITPAEARTGTGTYRNPLQVRSPLGRVESCADPTIIYGQKNEGAWFLYCTSDPLNDRDRDPSGNLNIRLIPTFRSTDLVNWTYVGDALTTRPSYAVANAGLWAPEVEYYAETGTYHLYYVVTDTTISGGGSAIGVATSDSPTGPWVQRDAPVVEPHAPDCCPDARRWVFDPEVLRTDGADYIYYGSYFGGISVRELSEDGFTSNPAAQKNVAVANKFEGAEIAFRNGYYYLFASATDCCRGPLTGYSVFVGRSKSPTGPFLDRDGVDLNDDERFDDPTDARVGGTPVLSMNGNGWVGPGHNTVFTDFDGQWWTIYHAINQDDPYFADPNPFRINKRPALMDPIDWVDGWPTVNGGAWISDTPQHAPAAQPGQKTNYKPRFAKPDEPGELLYDDEFDGTALSGDYTWVRQPDASTYGVANGVFRFTTQNADLFEGSNNASVLTLPGSKNDYIVQTRVKVDLPSEGCCYNYVQAGLVIYGDDDNYIKLASTSIFNTRQTEFAKELFPVPANYPRYGNTVVGAPSEWTYLRIVRDSRGDKEFYTPYTSRDGQNWTRGGTWTHQLGRDARIGLVAMGGGPRTAEFDYLRVYQLK